MDIDTYIGTPNRSSGSIYNDDQSSFLSCDLLDEQISNRKEQINSIRKMRAKKFNSSFDISPVRALPNFREQPTASDGPEQEDGFEERQDLESNNVPQNEYLRDEFSTPNSMKFKDFSSRQNQPPERFRVGNVVHTTPISAAKVSANVSSSSVQNLDQGHDSIITMENNKENMHLQDLSEDVDSADEELKHIVTEVHEYGVDRGIGIGMSLSRIDDNEEEDRELLHDSLLLESRFWKKNTPTTEEAQGDDHHLLIDGEYQVRFENLERKIEMQTETGQYLQSQIQQQQNTSINEQLMTTQTVERLHQQVQKLMQEQQKPDESIQVMQNKLHRQNEEIFKIGKELQLIKAEQKAQELMNEALVPDEPTKHWNHVAMLENKEDQDKQMQALWKELEQCREEIATLNGAFLKLPTPRLSQPKPSASVSRHFYLNVHPFEYVYSLVRS